MELVVSSFNSGHISPLSAENHQYIQQIISTTLPISTSSLHREHCYSLLFTENTATPFPITGSPKLGGNSGLTAEVCLSGTLHSKSPIGTSTSTGDLG